MNEVPPERLACQTNRGACRHATVPFIQFSTRSQGDDRLLLITFTRTIPLEERVEEIGQRIAAEEPDLLLAWALEGATRLIRQRNYAIPKSCHDDLLEWVLSEDPVGAWVGACVTVVPIVHRGPSIATRDAYQHFRDWALAEGYKSEKLHAINGFVQRVQACVAGIQHKRTSSGRVFVGIMVTQSNGSKLRPTGVNSVPVLERTNRVWPTSSSRR